MTDTTLPRIEPPHINHATISDAGTCPQCRAWTIGTVKDGPHAYLLTFPPEDGAPQAISLIRDWTPGWSSAADTAWATGCNLPRAVLIEEIPVGVAIESGVEMFRLHEGVEADDAFRAIQAATREDVAPTTSPRRRGE